jgi:hypothetical protein
MLVVVVGVKFYLVCAVRNTIIWVWSVFFYLGDECVMHIGVLEVGVRVGLVLATGLLFAVVCLAYRRVKSRKMLTSLSTL